MPSLVPCALLLRFTSGQLDVSPSFFRFTLVLLLFFCFNFCQFIIGRPRNPRWTLNGSARQVRRKTGLVKVCQSIITVKPCLLPSLDGVDKFELEIHGTWPRPNIISAALPEIIIDATTLTLYTEIFLPQAKMGLHSHETLAHRDEAGDGKHAISRYVVKLDTVVEKKYTEELMRR